MEPPSEAEACCRGCGKHAVVRGRSGEGNREQRRAKQCRAGSNLRWKRHERPVKPSGGQYGMNPIEKNPRTARKRKPGSAADCWNARHALDASRIAVRRVSNSADSRWKMDVWSELKLENEKSSKLLYRKSSRSARSGPHGR